MTNGNDTINVCHPQTDLGRGLTKREYFAAMAMQGLCVQAIAGSHNMDTITKKPLNLNQC